MDRMNAPGISPDLESEFRKRAGLYRAFSRLHPEATERELAEYLVQVRPIDESTGKLFARWFASESLRELHRGAAR